MIPHDAIIHPGTAKEPEMTWGTLYQLLCIAAEGNCPAVRWQPPQVYHDLASNGTWFQTFDVQALSLNGLIAKAMPVFKHIDDLHNQAAAARMERDDAVKLNKELQKDVHRLHNKLDAIREISE